MDGQLSKSLCPPGHAHNSSCYTRHRCRCGACTKSERERLRKYRRDIAYGRPHCVPIWPVQEYTRFLVAAGLSKNRIANLSGTSPSIICGIERGGKMRNGRLVPIAKVSTAVARRIMSVSPYAELLPTNLVPPEPSRRRLESLAFMGWSLSRVSKETALNREGLRRLFTSNTYTTKSTEDKIAVFYDAHCMSTPPASARGDAGAITRTKNTARSRGYLSPLAWDDIRTGEMPRHTRLDSRYTVDTVLVDQAIMGWKVKLNYQERREAIMRMERMGVSTERGSEIVGMSCRHYSSVRNELREQEADDNSRPLVS